MRSASLFERPSNFRVVGTDADSLKSATGLLVNHMEDPTAVILGSSPGVGMV